MKEKSAQLAAELLRRAQAADDAEDRRYGQDRRGDELPEELAFREGRLEKIREAMAALEAEAPAAAEQAEAEGKALPSTLRKIQKGQWMSPLWGNTTCGRSRKVFHCRQLPQTFKNSRPLLSSTLNRPRS